MKHVTIMDIAYELGISKSTVSRALDENNHNISKETKQKILEVANRLGYKRNELAINFRKQSTRTIGIIVPEMVTPFYVNFIACAQTLLNKLDYRVILAQSHEDADAERANLQMMEDYRVDGIMISACHNQKNIDIYRRLIEKEIPLIFMDRTVENISASKVKIDNYIKAFFMVEHLIRSGRKHIVHLSGPSYIQNALERRKAYIDALEKFQIPFQKEYLVDSGLSMEEGEKSMEAFIQQQIPFDAVFCFTEMCALGAKNCLEKHHFSIPEEVAVCCISGTSLSKLVHPSITTVEQPVEQMADIATELLIEKIENPDMVDKTVVLEAKMFLRDSTELKRE